METEKPEKQINSKLIIFLIIIAGIGSVAFYFNGICVASAEQAKNYYVIEVIDRIAGLDLKIGEEVKSIKPTPEEVEQQVYWKCMTNG